MRIINIVDSVAKINYGIWHAATANACLLAKQNIQTELWFPAAAFNELPCVYNVSLPALTTNALHQIIEERKLDPQNDIIITHGAWQFATRWGAHLKQKGFKWVYVPHGMLDPWALQQKRLKKALYLHLIEKRLAKKADLIKAVSLPESKGLRKFFRPVQIRFIPNGVEVQLKEMDLGGKKEIRRYLFLSRLHAKKNLVALAAAWAQSHLNNHSDYELLIAGPDQGELEKLNVYLQQSTNIKYVGSVYDNEKNKLLQQCTFYVLPSFSEGLPTALLEAMGYGLIPIITTHCNLPEVFTQNLGLKIATDELDIKKTLEESAMWEAKKIEDTARKAKEFITNSYSLQSITNQQKDIFLALLS